ncbi:hypothetical protein [Streptomyces sp. NPDC051909]|uniref:hypothetical protein n=1 Tax=Streptomyces sp. NPDC051909 TaxID=3154944 RepID=UPI0034482A30
MNDFGTDCQRLRENAAELALGVLPARERAAAVAHLDRCPGCRAYVQRLTAVGDGLLDLLPGAEPPLGFESRVVRVMLPSPADLAPSGAAPAGRPAVVGPAPTGPAPSGPAPQGPASPGPAPTDPASAAPAVVRPARRRRIRRFRLAAAVVAAALGVGFGGWAVGSAVEGAPAAPPMVAPGPRVLEAELLGEGGSPVGRIYAHPADGAGVNGWVYMSVDLGDRAAAAGDGPVRCVLVRADGSAVPVGSFPVRDGYGYWGAPAPVDPATLAGARLVAGDGTVLATARFSGP